MHFTPTLRYFQKNNAPVARHETPRYYLYDYAYFCKKPRFEKKCLFSDSLLKVSEGLK